MANNRDVEFKIRARDYSQKTLKQVTSAINDMSKAQDAQKAAAERGEVSAKDLEASYRKLEDAGKQLLKLNALVEVWKRQSAAQVEAAKKIEAAKIKQQELTAAMETAEKVTKRQEQAVARAGRAVEAATKSEANAAAALKRTTAELDRYGIKTNEVGAAQAKIVADVGRVNAVLERQDKIINESGAAAERYKAAKAAQAAADAKAAQAAADAMARTQEVAIAQNKVIDSLRRQADQAIAASKGYQTLGRVVSTVTVDVNGLATRLNGIVSPANAARSTLSGLEGQVAGLDAASRTAAKDITDINGKIRQLGQAQAAAVGMAKLIDSFRNQTAAVRTARNEFNSAKADVQRLAAQMRSASSDTGALGLQMQAAQARLNTAASALRSTGSAARTTQAALRAAGIDTRNLTDAEQRLISSTTTSTATVQRLTQALNENAGASKKSAGAFSFFADEGRKSLSMLQRVRGEVLALVTAYVGLQGGISLAGGAVDAYKTRQQAMVKIGTVVGQSQEAQASEWQYMIDLSNKLGIRLDTLAQSYTKFAVSAKATGLTMQETKFIFESVAKAGRVFHLSADDMDGIFRAMQQMLSKGQVYAEELNGQLGERLPGAIALFAKGMNMTVQELLKQMQNGAVSGRDVINFAREQAKAVDAQLSVAEKGVDAMEARATNAMFMFKLAISDSGFIDAYTQVLQRLTDYLNSPDGEEGAKKIGQAFIYAADGIIWCVDNMDLLIDVFAAFAALKIVGIVINIGQQIGKLGTLFKTLGAIGDGIIGFLELLAARMATGSGAVKALSLVIGGLARAIPYVGWALLAYDIGAIFYEQSQTFAKTCDEVARDFKNLGNQLVAVLYTFPAILQDVTTMFVRPITTMFADTLKSIGKWIADVVRLIPGVGEDLADFVMSVTDNITKDNRDMFQNTSAVWDDVNKKWNKMNDDIAAKYSNTMDKVVKDTLEAKAKMLQADLAGATKFEYTADPQSGTTDRDRQILALTKQFDKLTEASKKAELAGKKALQRKNLPGRLALVDEEYKPQMDQAKAVGGKEGDKLVAQLNQVIAARKRAETDEFNASQRSASGVNKRQNAIDALTKAYENLNATVGVKTEQIDPNATYESRLAANLAKINVQYDQLIAKSKKIGGAEGAGLQKQFEDLRKVNLATTTQQTQLEEVQRLTDKANTQIETKRNLLDEINAKQKAGLISQDEQVASTVELYQSMNGQIAQSVNALEQFAIKMRGIMTPEQLAQIQAGIATMRAGLTDISGTFTAMDQQVVQGTLSAMSTALTSVKDNMVQVVIGAQSIGQAFVNLGATVAQFFADFLMEIAQAILKQMILNALAGIGGGIGAAATSAGGVAAGAASKKHNGGIVGSKTSGGQQTASSVPMSIFANAPKFHNGGMPGLRSDEVPTILQKGEQVLSKDDPNNILNQTGKGGGNAPAPNMRFVLVDDRAKIPEAMNTPAGEIAVMQILQRNAPTVRQIAKKGRT